MEFGYDKIDMPCTHSFIAKKIPKHREDNARVHSHKNYELNYVVSGKGRRIVGNNVSDYSAGDLVLLGPNLPHSWEHHRDENGTESFTITVHFDENLINSNFFNVPELEKVQELLSQADGGVVFLGKHLDKIKSHLTRLVSLDGLEAYIKLLKIFLLLLRTEEKNYLSVDSGYPSTFSKDIDRINIIYDYVRNNLQNKISLDDAADLLSMAPGSFSRYFKKKTKRTFSQYVKSVRIGLAAKMLAETDKQITWICFDSGYHNLANFNHQFKLIMKKTPSEYRKMFRD